MSQPILKLNATKNTRGTIVNAGAHKSNFGAAFPDAGLLSQLADMGYSVKRAGKALIETNNKDLASALDWLEIHQFELEDDDFMDVDEPAPIITATAAISSNPATMAPLESRIKPDSRDAFLERQRLKEIEEMKKEKAEKAKREAEIKAKIEEEKRQRTSHTVTASDIDPEEAKRQFELKQRQKEAEEAKRKRQAEIEEKERIRREMEAEKQLRAARMGINPTAGATTTTAPPSSSTNNPELSAAEKSKQEYLKEKKEDALARERLRKQIEEDKAKRFGPPKSSQELEAEQRKAKQAQLELANARRARLGLPLFDSIEAMDSASGTSASSSHETDSEAPLVTQPQQLESSGDPAAAAALREARIRNLTSQTKTFEATVDNTELPASAPAPAPSAAIDLKELARLRAQRTNQLDRLAASNQAAPAAVSPTSQPAAPLTSTLSDAEIQAREARLQRLLQQQQQQQQPVETATLTLPAEPEPQQPKAMIQFRMPDGRIVPGEFAKTEIFKTVHEYAAAFMPMGTIFNLMIPHPRREFEHSDFPLSINDLGLYPRATLTVLTLDLRGVALQGTGPVYAEDDEMDIDNMDYEQLQDLGSRMGHVRAGLTAAQISRLPSTQYSSELHETHICAICREEFDDKRMVTQLSCTHVYHTSPCITLWLRDHHNCPYCKQDIVFPKPQ